MYVYTQKSHVIVYFFFPLCTFNITLTQIFNSSILWQPIPVHTVPQDEDRVCAVCESVCHMHMYTYTYMYMFMLCFKSHLIRVQHTFWFCSTIVPCCVAFVFPSYLACIYMYTVHVHYSSGPSDVPLPHFTYTIDAQNQLVYTLYITKSNVFQLLRAYDVNCPTYTALRELDKQSSEYKKIDEENQVCSPPPSLLFISCYV